jgi:lysophospholipase L1-like esterase
MKGISIVAALSVSSAAVLIFSLGLNGARRAEDVAKPAAACEAPKELLRLDYKLERTARQIEKLQPLRIVAIGSSSTAGYGASSPAMSYPSRLEAELRVMLPRTSITVFNRGVGGEVARDMLARFDSGVFAANPDLVLWQVGSNSVLKNSPVEPNAVLLHEGLARLKAARVDIILINPQYAPKVLAHHNVDQMVDMIDATARAEHVDLFQRFALMRYWRLTEDMPFSSFLSKDELHMNDWSYGCLGKLLADSITDAVKRPTLTAKVGRRS